MTCGSSTAPSRSGVVAPRSPGSSSSQARAGSERSSTSPALLRAARSEASSPPDTRANTLKPCASSTASPTSSSSSHVTPTVKRPSRRGRGRSGRSVHPFGIWRYVGFGMWPGTVESCGGHGQQYPHLLVAVGQSLAREPDLPEKVALLEHFELGPGHLLGLAFEVLDSTGSAPGVGAAAVQDVYARILLDRQDQPLVLGNVESSYTLDL